MDDDDARRPALHEAVLVWGLFALDAVAILVTYSRLSPERLYHVSEGRLGGGAGRTLVFLGYPTALVAVAIVGIACARLARRWAWATGAVAVLLCLTIGWPGVIDQDDLDAKPANVLAALGVLLALGLTAAAWRLEGLGRPRALGPLDALRAGLAAVLVAAALPWMSAELGYSLGGPFLGSELRPEQGNPTQIAVHLGHHHGLDGTLLALTALVLSRAVPLVRSGALKVALGVYLALMFVYGLANALQDFWLEQLVKRHTTSLDLPSMIRPSLSPAWAAILAAALLLYLAASRRSKVP